MKSRKPERIKYPKSTDRYRHYGGYVNEMISKAKTMDNLEKKEAFAIIIASYMKTAFSNWNKEHFISDESIKEDLANMSNGELKISDDVTLEVNIGTPRHQRNRGFQKTSKNGKLSNNKNKFKRNNNNPRRG